LRPTDKVGDTSRRAKRATIMNRRTFLRAGLMGGASTMLPRFARGGGTSRVSLVIDPADPIAGAPSAGWAIDALACALGEAGVAVRRVPRVAAATGDRVLVVSGHDHADATAALRRAGVSIGDGPERLALIEDVPGSRFVACASDARGLTYGLTELADRVRFSDDPLDAFAQRSPIVERPANAVRSVMRQFTSQTLDTAWFHDREMWPAYLSMLAAARFNRLHLAFGLGYDALRQVVDSYLLFLYPFLIDVPGYGVRVTNVDAAERERNLQTLRFISEQTVAHGLTFQLGIWMHGYEMIDSPEARYRVEGLTPASHAVYCRDALTALLRACPAISAVALRIHGESGIKEGSYEFWQTVFEGAARAGRTIEIDLHAKGIDHEMIDRALGTGMPVNVAPKYWAEHLGLPYQQTAIRELERPVEGRTGAGLMTLSEGARSFTRYGYADLLRDDRRYTVRYRMFAGTQRLLVSADAPAAAAHARAFTFGGATGMDLMEPLTCRGRRGTGVAGTARSGYADRSLDTRRDWEKFALWYRTWGLAAYDPDTPSSVMLRPLGPATAAARSLMRASRILPLVTTAHLPSAACDAYWPEVYWNQPIVGEPRPNPYGDTPSPKTFTHFSPIDPEIFAGTAEHADDLLRGRPSAKYSPTVVATHLESLVAGIDAAALARNTSADGRRVAIDVRIQAGLGSFFAAKLRAGVLYALFERTGNRAALDAALESYRRARTAWADLCDAARRVYAADLSASDRFSERGQWADRLAAIDEDIARMEKSTATVSDAPDAAAAIAHARGRAQPAVASCRHTAPAHFEPGRALPIEISSPGARGVFCHYRHVNQAERFERLAMTAGSRGWRCEIPASYTGSPYSLQYYFVVELGNGQHAFYPGLGADLLTTPYFVVGGPRRQNPEVQM
jgi:hypothetical protein